MTKTTLNYEEWKKYQDSLPKTEAVLELDFGPEPIEYDDETQLDFE
jgi:hypothetical protein